jgi:hypothetical protein
MSQPLSAAPKQLTADQILLKEMPTRELVTPASRIGYLLERGFSGTYSIPGRYTTVQLLPPSASWFRPALDVLRSRDELESLRVRWPKEVSVAEEAAKKFTEKDRQQCRESYMLHWLIAIGEFEAADEMIAAGSVIIKQDHMNICRSPIGVALMWGHEEYAKSLLERGIVEPPSPCQNDPRENRLGIAYVKISFDMIEMLLKITEGPAPTSLQYKGDWSTRKWAMRDPKIYQMVLLREDIPFEQRKTMVERLRNVYKLPFSRGRKIVYDDEEDEAESDWRDHDSDGGYSGGGYQAHHELIEDEITGSWYTDVATLPPDEMFWVWNWGWRFDFWHNPRKRNDFYNEEKRDDSLTIGKTIDILGARSQELIEKALAWMRSHGFRWPVSDWSWLANVEVPTNTKLAVLKNLLTSRGWAGRVSPAEIKKQQAFGATWRHPSKPIKQMGDLSQLLDHAVRSGSLQLAQSIWVMGWRYLANPETITVFSRPLARYSGGKKADEPAEIAASVELLKWLLDDGVCGKQIAELLLDRNALSCFTDKAQYLGYSFGQDDSSSKENTSAMACWDVVRNWPPAAQRIARDEVFKAAMNKLWESDLAEDGAARKRNDLELNDVDSEYSCQQPDYQIRRTSLKQAHAQGKLNREIKQEQALLSLKLEQLESCHVQYRTAVQQRLRSAPETCKKVLPAIDRQQVRLTDEMISHSNMVIESKQRMYLDAKRWGSFY